VRARTAAALIVVAPLFACRSEQSPDRKEPDMPDVITVTSTAFHDGAAIPSNYTCDGANLAPPLAWTGVPDDAAVLALVVDDPDAPAGTFTHWVVLDIPVSTADVAEGGVPTGGVQAMNSARQSSYFGPCPPSGTHRYRFNVYALSTPTNLGEGSDLAAALKAIDADAVARGRLIGTYQRRR